MKRTQVQLDEETYQALKNKAFERGVSMSCLLRELVRKELVPPKKKLRIEDFTFIASGKSDDRHLSPVSERHDDALAEDFAR